MVSARKGDTLASLAARHGVSAANMVTWNKLKPNAHLSSGQSLAVLVPTSQSPRLSAKPAPHKKAGPAPHRTASKHAKR
jgi:LysM repeat protein